MKKVKKEYFLSNRILSNYKQVPTAEAEAWLTAQGYRFIYIAEDGTIHARSQSNKLLEGYRLYVRDVPDI